MAAIIIHGLDPKTLKPKQRTRDRAGPVTIPSPVLEDDHALRLEAKRNAASVRAGAVARQAAATGPANEKWILIDGKYRQNPNYDPPFDITLGQAIAIPPLIGAAGALLPEAAAAAAGVYRFARAGHELKFGPNVRIAPFGNRTNDPYGKWPHYHRRPAERLPDGQSPPGQGIGRHRPWQPSGEHDKWPWDRF